MTDAEMYEFVWLLISIMLANYFFRSPHSPANILKRKIEEVRNEPDSVNDNITALASESVDGVNTVRPWFERLYPDAGDAAKAFLGGALGMYEAILQGLASNDLSTLKTYIADDVWECLDDDISHRRIMGHSITTTIIGVRLVEIIGVSEQAGWVSVEVRFVTHIVTVCHGPEGKVVWGHPRNIVQADDIWTFTHERESMDPNWHLTALSSDAPALKDV